MSEPLLPHPSTGSGDREVPGLDHDAGLTDEPDVLTGPPEPETGPGLEDLPETPFRTPVAGDALSPEELAEES